MTPIQRLTWDSRPGANGSTVHLPKYSEVEAETEPVVDEGFTSGPWQLNDRTIYGGPDEQSIAELTNRHHSSMLPNGRLIAASPDLYHAVVAIQNRVPLVDFPQDEHTCGDCAVCHEIAERALHKADGSNP